MKNIAPTNREIALLLENIADLLEIQEANQFRVQAYRAGGQFIRDYESSVAEIVLSGNGESLQDLPYIGERLSGLIREYVKTGKSQLLQRLEGEVTPEELFEQVPGIGEGLAERIVKELDIRTLEELEQATHDGRLAKVEGFGPKRIRACLNLAFESKASKFYSERGAKREPSRS